MCLAFQHSFLFVHLDSINSFQHLFLLFELFFHIKQGIVRFYMQLFLFQEIIYILKVILWSFQPKAIKKSIN